MEASLIRTKLVVPPLRAERVERPHLLARLNAGLERKLTLVSAPAGSGKTTLLSEWAARAGRPVAWLSLDERDNDPARFLTYLAAALAQAGERAAAAARPEAARSIEAVLAALIDDLAGADRPLLLVLDDYHLVEAAPVHQAVGFLIERQPAQLHLAISTRLVPPLPLARLRARQEIAEFREQDLRFSAAEAEMLLNGVLALRLPARSIAALEARTEGWIAGLQLAALSLRDRRDAEAFVSEFAGDDRLVTDYLVEEVLAHQPEEIRQFLLHTSILDRFNATLCAEMVTGLASTAAAQDMLERLDAAHLFIVPLDNRRQWFRYHHLFADLLRRALEREHPGRAGALHRRASEWHARAGDAEEAVDHAFAIPDIPLAVSLIEQAGSRLLDSGRVATLLTWVNRIPGDVIDRNPYLCTGAGWAHALTGQVDRAERYAAAGEAALPGYEPFYARDLGRIVSREEVRGDLATLRAYCARMRGDSAGALDYSRQASEHLPDGAGSTRAVLALNLGLVHYEKWELDAALEAFETASAAGSESTEQHFVAVSALNMQGEILATTGRLREAERRYRRAIELAQGRAGGGPTPGMDAGHLGLAAIHSQRNEIVAALGHVDRALEIAPGTPERGVAAGAWLLRFRLALQAGNPSQARAQLEQADRLMEGAEPEGTAYAAWRAAAWAEFHLARGDPAAAAEAVAALGLGAEAPGETPCRRLPDHLLAARLMLAQGQTASAAVRFEELAALAGSSRRMTEQIEAAVFAAVAHHVSRSPARALACIERALELAGPEGYIRPFLIAGKSVATLVRRALVPGRRMEHAEDVLSALIAQSRLGGLPVPSAAAPGGAAPPREPLTRRERQILRLLAAGLSSNEVAEEVVISVNTARSYIKAIYRKLGVHGREEAIARAQALELL